MLTLCSSDIRCTSLTGKIRDSLRSAATQEAANFCLPRYVTAATLQQMRQPAQIGGIRKCAAKSVVLVGKSFITCSTRSSFPVRIPGMSTTRHDRFGSHDPHSRWIVQLMQTFQRPAIHLRRRACGEVWGLHVQYAIRFRQQQRQLRRPAAPSRTAPRHEPVYFQFRDLSGAHASVPYSSITPAIHSTQNIGAVATASV